MKCVFAPFDCPVPKAYDSDRFDSKTLAQFCQACPITKAIPKEFWESYIKEISTDKGTVVEFVYDVPCDKLATLYRCDQNEIITTDMPHEII